MLNELPVTERQAWHDLTHMWNLKSEFHGSLEQSGGYQRLGVRSVEGEAGQWAQCQS